MTIKVDTKELAPAVARAIIAALFFELKRVAYPKELKGDAAAGGLMGVTTECMKQRRRSGYYEEGTHFWKKSDKIVIWDRDALLETILEKNNDKGQTIL